MKFQQKKIKYKNAEKNCKNKRWQKELVKEHLLKEV